MNYTLLHVSPSLPVTRRSEAFGAAAVDTAAPGPGTNLRSGDKYGEHHPSVLGAPCPRPACQAPSEKTGRVSTPTALWSRQRQLFLHQPSRGPVPVGEALPTHLLELKVSALGFPVQMTPVDESPQKPLPPKPQVFAPAGCKHPFDRHFLCAQARGGGGHAKMRKAWPHPRQFHSGLASPV